MDEAYNQHSRRNARSSTNLTHLSLAPLTSKLPLNDSEELSDHSIHLRIPHDRHISYLEGRSAPTTPSILSRTSSRVSLRKPIYSTLPKSKSSANITGCQNQLKFGADTLFTKSKHVTAKDDLSLESLTAEERNDSDWLLRAGALLSLGAKESKGQSWLVSRESSTSLTAQRDHDVEEFELELARERDSRRNSIRGSATGADADDEYSPITTRLSFGAGSRSASRYGSCPTSRAHSRRGSRANVPTPLPKAENERESYFDGEEGIVVEPDFVDVEEDAHDEDQAIKDEIIVKRLAKNGTLGLGVWMEKLMGWSLFAVDEDGEDTDTETCEEKTDVTCGPPPTLDALNHNFCPSQDTSEDEKLPPPGDGEGGWQDAAWLLSVATKVLL
jgi:Protein of unknown function (DUF3984)